MDDAHFFNNGIYLNTQSFSLVELNSLQKALSNLEICSKVRLVSGDKKR
jgi:hypothetical protein